MRPHAAIRVICKNVLWGSLALILALCLAWRHLLLQGMIPLDGNMIALSYPNWSLLRLLGPALWNPYRNLGEPFAADPQTMAFYPPAWLLSGLSSFVDFLRLWIVGHTLLAALFLALLAWRWYRDPAAAVAAGALAGLNAFFTARASFPPHFASAAWLPVALYFQDKGSALGIGVCLALQWLAGFPPFSCLSALALFFMALGQGRAGLVRFARGCAWALGLAAVQWVPFLEMLLLSERRLLLDTRVAVDYSMSWRLLLKELLLPQWYAFSPEIPGDPAIMAFYVGLAALALALWAALRGGKRERWLGAAAALSFFLSLGSGLPFYAELPFLHIFRFPANWLLPASTALALLAAAGTCRLPSQRLRWAAAAIIALDLLAFSQHSRLAWAKPGFFQEAPPLAEEARRLGPHARIYHAPRLRQAWEKSYLETEEDYEVMRDFLAPSLAAGLGVPEFSSYQTLRPSRAGAFQRRAAAAGPNSELFSLAGVSILVDIEEQAPRPARRHLTVRLRPPPLPRLFLRDKDAGSAEILDYRAGRVEAKTRVSKPALAVLSEIAYPGWRAMIDGEAAPVSLFEETFLAVTVPAGEHSVAFRYEPFSFKAGLVMTSAALLLMVALLTVKKFRILL